MATKFTPKKPVSSDSGFFELLEKHWMLILSGLILIPFLFRWVTALIAQAKASTYKAETVVNNAQNGKSSPTVIAKKSFDISKKYPLVKQTEMNRYKAVAQKLALCLGTNVEDNHYILGTDLFNVSAWSEDEAGAVRLLKTVPTTFPIIEDLYYNVFTRSRNLKTDLYEYLSLSDLDEVRKVWNKYGTKNNI